MTNDDLIIGSDNEEFKCIRDKFEVTFLGLLLHFLGYAIERADGCYSLQLTPFIECVLRRFKMENFHAVKKLMDIGHVTENEDSQPFEDMTLYRSLIGACIWPLMRGPIVAERRTVGQTGDSIR